MLRLSNNSITPEHAIAYLTANDDMPYDPPSPKEVHNDVMSMEIRSGSRPKQLIILFYCHVNLFPFLHTFLHEPGPVSCIGTFSLLLFSSHLVSSTLIHSHPLSSTLCSYSSFYPLLALSHLASFSSFPACMTKFLQISESHYNPPRTLYGHAKLPGCLLT